MKERSYWVGKLDIAIAGNVATKKEGVPMIERNCTNIGPRAIGIRIPTRIASINTG